MIDSSFSFENAINEYGMQRFAMAIGFIIRKQFSKDKQIRLGQFMQFLREECDAMRIAGGYAAKFATSIFENECDYKGSLSEDTKFPIDYPDGPQQTLLQIRMALVDEVGRDSNLPGKFSCEVVNSLCILEIIQDKIVLNSKKFDNINKTEAKRLMRIGYNILGILFDRSITL